MAKIGLAANEYGVVFTAPSAIGKPFIILVGHERDAPHRLLQYRQEEAGAFLRDLEGLDRNDDAVVSGCEESA